MNKKDILKTLDFAYTAMYAWVALWAMIFSGLIPQGWIELSAILATGLMIIDISLILVRLKLRIKHKTKQTKLSLFARFEG